MKKKNWFVPSHNEMIVYSACLHIVVLYFIFNSEPWQWAICFLVYGIKTIFGTVVVHRLITHRSFSAPKWFEYLGTLIAIPGSTLPILYWVAVHRAHHRYSDTKDDPHSPAVYGFWAVQFRLTPAIPKLSYVPEIVKSKFHMHMYYNHWLYAILVGVAVYMIDPYAVVYAYLVPCCFVQHVSSLTNSLTHSPMGYRNFDTRDQSSNHLLVGYLTGGEGWHNNHHASAADPQFGKKWWEFDPGYYLIQLVRTDKDR